MGQGKSIETSLMGNMVRMVRRNLKISLALLPELMQLRRRLEYQTDMITAKRDAWKVIQGETLRRELKALLVKYRLPVYLLDFLEWLFMANEEEIGQLKAYIARPRGRTPAAYYCLVKPAFQFTTPFRTGWLTDAGYQVAIGTVEESGLWQVWGTRVFNDTRDFSGDDTRMFVPMLLKQILRVSGDFVVFGNLELFDANSWRELGKFLAQVKKNKGMGRPLGLVAGRQKGALVRRKKILRGMSWREIQILVAEQPQLYHRLHNEYANLRTEQYRGKFKQNNSGQEPLSWELKQARESAIRNFARCVKKPVPPVAG